MTKGEIPGHCLKKACNQILFYFVILFVHKWIRYSKLFIFHFYFVTAQPHTTRGKCWRCVCLSASRSLCAFGYTSRCGRGSTRIYYTKQWCITCFIEIYIGGSRPLFKSVKTAYLIRREMTFGDWFQWIGDNKNVLLYFITVLNGYRFFFLLSLKLMNCLTVQIMNHLTSIV